MGTLDYLIVNHLKETGTFGDLYTMTVKSEHRLRPRSASQTDFYYDPVPKHVFVKRLQLMNCSIPFTFNNITTTYGNSLELTITPDTAVPGTSYDITVTIPSQFFDIVQLIDYINYEIDVQRIALGIPVVISFSISGTKNNYLQINSSSLVASVTITPPSLSYVLTMLGTPTTAATTYTFVTSYFATLPFPFTEKLPFRYVYIHIDPLPPCVYTSLQGNAHFVIPVDSYRPYIQRQNGSIQESIPVSYNYSAKFPQEVLYLSNITRIPLLHIRLTDEELNDLSEHSGNVEWNMALNVFGIDAYDNPSNVFGDLSGVPQKRQRIM